MSISTPPRSQPLKTAENSRADHSRGGQRLTDGQVGVLLVLPALALFLVVIAYPLVNSMVLSLFDRSLLYPGQQFVGLDNIRSVLGREFVPVAINTVVFSVGAMALPLVIGFALALLLNRGIRGQAVLRGLFLMPWIMPAVVVSFVWLWIFNPSYGVLNGALRQLGVIDSNVFWLGSPTFAMAAVILANTWITFPWMMVMLLAGLQTVPRELLEAASVDGAHRWHQLRYITIPHLRGILLVVALLSLIWNFQHFDIIYVMTRGGPAQATTTFSISLYQTAFQSFDLGRAGAIGLLWMLLLSVLAWGYIRMGDED